MDSVISLEQNRFVTQVFGWMFGGLLLTAGVASVIAATPALYTVIIANPFVFFGLLILELLLVGSLALAVRKMSPTVAMLTFLGYAALNGVTFSLIFLAYTSASIASTFAITAVTFGAMSFYGYVTKKDLTSIGSIAIMALIGIIIASVVNIFLNNSAIYWITTYAGILIFVALTAYDTQKIKQMNVPGNEGTGEEKKEAIMGALALYLDFINLFLFLLRIFGRRRK